PHLNAAAASFQVDADPRLDAVAGQRLGLPDELLALIEALAQTLHSRQLCQQLRTSAVGGLLIKLRVKTLLGPVEIIEVPKATEPVGHQLGSGTPTCWITRFMPRSSSSWVTHQCGDSRTRPGRESTMTPSSWSRRSTSSGCCDSSVTMPHRRSGS